MFFFFKHKTACEMRISDWSSDVCSSDLLPGQNESLAPLADVDLERWQDALAEVVATIDGPAIVASVRGGALIDHRAKAAAWWRLAPAGSASLDRQSVV